MLTDIRPDREGFNPAGAYRLAPEVVAMALPFARQHNALEHGSQVLTFDGSIETSVRKPGSDVWQDLGPTIAMAIYRRRLVPAVALSRQDGLIFATKIPLEMMAPGHRRVIVYDPAAYFELTLT
jgi:hypothetical protein